MIAEMLDYIVDYGSRSLVKCPPTKWAMAIPKIVPSDAWLDPEDYIAIVTVITGLIRCPMRISRLWHDLHSGIAHGFVSFDFVLIRFD
jgi:hypothetical protein